MRIPSKLLVGKKNNHYFSRIHVEDIAEVLTISLKKFSPGQIYNVSDNYPCPNDEIARYAANLMKMDKPKIIKSTAWYISLLPIFITIAILTMFGI